jgi:orotidine-5'-phosphate decarboxylase
MDAGDIAEMGYTNHSVEELVLFRARNALEAGCDGTIASGLEARKIKELSHNKLLVATPGIRPEGYGPDDQKRRSTPRSAILEGADYLVVGRPIIEPKDTTPRKAAEGILADMESAFQSLHQDA